MNRPYVLAAGAALLASTAWNAAQAQVPPRTRGTIASVEGDVMTLTTRQGASVKVTLGGDVKVLGVTHAQISDIKANTFIGTAAAPQPDGTLKALEVTIFPESLRGTNEGNYGWDLGGSSTMTNGNVGTVSGTSGRSMTVDYKGGQKQVVVPDDVPIVDLEPGTRALLVPGAKVVVFGPKAADGTVDAKAIAAGENGVQPPM